MTTTNPTRRVVRWVLLLAAFAAFIILIVVAMLSLSGRSGSRSGMEETPSATPAPSSTSDGTQDEGDLPEVIADNPYDCKLHLTPEEYGSFTKRLMEFEAIRLSTSQDKLGLLTPFATEDFLKTQTDVGNTVVTTVSISLENPSPFGCYMDKPTEIAAYVNPFVTITNSEPGGIQKQHQSLSTHRTQWLKVGGSWYVNQELF
ncbi:MAG: hypothetical protein ACOH18_02555 [Candidatus Saccharimonadaceae bacterium]